MSLFESQNPAYTVHSESNNDSVTQSIQTTETELQKHTEFSDGTHHVILLLSTAMTETYREWCAQQGETVEIPQKKKQRTRGRRKGPGKSTTVFTESDEDEDEDEPREESEDAVENPDEEKEEEEEDEDEFTPDAVSEEDVEELLHDFKNLAKKVCGKKPGETVVFDASSNPLALYIWQAADTPLLTRTQEEELTRHMVSERTQWRLNLMTNGYIKKSIIKFHRLIVTNKHPPRNYLKFPDEKGEVARVRELIAANLPRIEQLEANLDYFIKKAAYEVRCGRELSTEECTARNAVQTELFELLEQIPVRHEWMVDTYKKLRTEKIPGKDSANPQKKDIADFIERLYETPEQFDSCLTAAGFHYDRWLESRTHLAKANLRLVISIAKKFRNRGVSFLDLIQDGNTGLVYSLDKFEPALGNRISTYATYWIYQRIRRELRLTGGAATIASDIYQIIGKIRRFDNVYLATHGHMPDNAATLAHLCTLGVDATPGKVITARRAMNKTLNINHETGENEDGDFSEMLEQQNEPSPEMQTQANLLRAAVRNSLLSLAPGDQEIIIQRYGLGMKRIETNNGMELQDDESSYGKKITLVKTSQQSAGTKVTRERIRQRQRNTLRKLADAAHPLRTELCHIGREFVGKRPVNPADIKRRPFKELPEGNDPENPALDLPVAQLPLPQRLINSLEDAHIFLLRDVVTCTNHMLDEAGIGDVSRKLLDKQLTMRGLIRSTHTPPITRNTQENTP